MFRSQIRWILEFNVAVRKLHVSGKGPGLHRICGLHLLPLRSSAVSLYRSSTSTSSIKDMVSRLEKAGARRCSSHTVTVLLMRPFVKGELSAGVTERSLPTLADVCGIGDRLAYGSAASAEKPRKIG